MSGGEGRGQPTLRLLVISHPVFYGPELFGAGSCMGGDQRASSESFPHHHHPPNPGVVRIAKCYLVLLQPTSFSDVCFLFFFSFLSLLLSMGCLRKGRMKNKMLFLPACPCSPLSLFITRLSLLSLLLLKLISFPFSPIQGLNAECSIFHLRPLIALPPLTFYRYHIMGANLANY